MISLTGIPKWVWSLAAVAAILVGLWFYGNSRYNAGQENIQSKWDAAIERGRAEVERLKGEAGKITVKTEIQYVERIKTIKEKGDVIVKQVEVFVPVDSGYTNGGFRVYHDAAANNTIPDTTEIANAAPAALTDVATTIAQNYNLYHQCRATLTGLQTWVIEQCKLNKEGCPDGG